MAELSIRSTSAISSKSNAVTGFLRIYTDSPLADPAPSPFLITIKVTNLVPDVDFSMDGFTWVQGGSNDWTGTKEIVYSSLTPTSSIILYVNPLALSQIGSLDGNFELMATGLYTVDIANDDVNFTIEGNPDTLLLLPGVISFHNKLKAHNKNYALVDVYNTAADPYNITGFYIPDDVNGTILYYYNLGSGSTWTAFSNGNSSVQVPAGDFIRMLIEVDSDTELDMSELYVMMTYEDTIVDPPSTSNSVWKIDPLAVMAEIENSVAGCVVVDILSFTFVDGSTKPAVNDVSAPVDLGDVISSEVVNSYADVVIRVTNNCVQVCDNGATSGNIRIGDMQSGWYSWIESTDGADVSITTTTPVSDAGYLIATGGNKTLTLRITPDSELGAHSLIFKIANLICAGASVFAADTFQNADLVAVAGLPETLDAALAGTDFNLIDISEFSQGETPSSISSQTISHTYGAKWGGGKSRTGYVFVAPTTRTYYVAIAYSCGDAIGASERDISYYINGAQSAVITDNQYPHTGYLQAIIALTAGDKLSFGAYTDQSENISTNFSVAVSKVPFTGAPDVEVVCDVELEWNVITEDIAVTPEEPSKTSVVGQSEQLQVTLINNGTADEVITNITISPSILSDLHIYFPSNITIQAGSSHEFVFSFNPASEYANKSGSITFTKSTGSDVVVPVLLTGTAAAIECDTAPTQSTITVNVDLGVAESFSNSLIFNVGDNSGTLQVSRTGATEVSFGSGSASVQMSVFQNMSVPVPFVIHAEDPSVPIINTSLNWALIIGGVTVCSGVITLNINVAMPLTTVCPVAFESTQIVIDGCHPEDDEDIDTNIKLLLTPAVIGGFDFELELPVDEAVLSFVNPQQALSGLTWDYGDLGANPSVLKCRVENTFSGVLVPIKLNYVVPVDYTEEQYLASIISRTIFDSGLYDCDESQPSTSIILNVDSDITTGGFGAGVEISDNILCNTINITDLSTYGTGNNHDAANFSAYREIVVRRPDGNDYVMSSVGGDEAIAPASGGVLLYPTSILSGGVYQVTLYTVPTYKEDTVLAYSVGDCVVIDSVDPVEFYKLIDGDGIGIIPGTTPGWEDSWELLNGRESLESPYMATELYVQMCEITTKRIQLQERLFCSGDSQCTNYDACFMLYEQIRLYERLILEAKNYGWLSKVELLYAAAILIANKTSTC